MNTADPRRPGPDRADDHGDAPLVAPATPASPRHQWMVPIIGALIAVTLGAGLSFLTTDAARATPTVDDRQVAAAVVAIASTAEPATEEDLDPFEGIQVPPPAPAASVDDVEPEVQLPVPEIPPADPYEATPEVVHGTLAIPAIGLEQPLFEGVTLTAINRGPSHWPGTAMPGEIGNVVVAGHRTTYTRPFWDLQAVQPGDELIFAMANGNRFVYVLQETEVVLPTDVHIIEQRPEHTATLFACHPRGSARQRIVAHFVLDPDRSHVELPPTSATFRTF